jgi:hypothetical protein
MASRGKWTVIFEDKKIIKNYDEGASEGISFKILDNDAFWNDTKFDNIWAIQYGTSVSSDEVEYKDTTPHTSFADANLGAISQFSDKWDALYLAQIQADWDNDGVLDETSEEKIARLGARPTSYTSNPV